MPSGAYCPVSQDSELGTPLCAPSMLPLTSVTCASSLAHISGREQSAGWVGALQMGGRSGCLVQGHLQWQFLATEMGSVPPRVWKRQMILGSGINYNPVWSLEKAIPFPWIFFVCVLEWTSNEGGCETQSTHQRESANCGIVEALRNC